MNTPHITLRHFSLLLIACLIGAGAWDWGHAHDRPAIDWDALTAEKAMPGQLIVGYRKGVSMQSVNEVHAQVGAQVAHQYRLIPAQVVELPRRMSLREAAEIYASSPAIAYVEPNYVVHALQTRPNDPLYNDLWGMKRIRGPEAWDFETGNRDIVVAVIDTGINYNHEDLVANIWQNPNPDPLVNDNHGARWTGGLGQMTSGDPMDDNDHGTHCAGTIGAVGNNNIGVVGVVWNVRLAAMKFLRFDGRGATADAIAAIEYCVERADEIKIISNSWGGGGYSQALFDIIEQSRDAGQLFIAAAGNESRNNDAVPAYPASYKVDNIISVAAINEDGELAGFSNYGEQSVHLGAPGVDILSTVAFDEGEPSDENYESFQGTSMACPHVAGAAALLWSFAPDASWKQVKDAILKGVEPNAELAGRTTTGGELDLMNALLHMGGLIELDRRAYQSDAAVEVGVYDFSLPDEQDTVTVGLTMLQGGGPPIRWTDSVEIEKVDPDERYFEDFVQLQNTDEADPFYAAHGDVLRLSYMDGFGQTVSRSVPIDDVPPVLSNLVITAVTESGATVIWQTDEPADSRVWVGETLPPLDPDLDPDLVQGSSEYVEIQTVRSGVTGYWHQVSLEGLEEETRYYIAVLSADFAGNEASLPEDLTSDIADDYERILTRQRRVLYTQTWESGAQGWTVTNVQGVLCWEWGTPRYGPLYAFSGTNCWGTVLDGRYPALANASLTSPHFELGERPRLSVRHWYDIEDFYDFGYIEANRGAGWERLHEVTGESVDWMHDVFELPAQFEYTTTRFRFRFKSDYTVEYAGWYVDDLEISALSPLAVYISGYEVMDAAPGGDGDGFAEPGETFVLRLDAFNGKEVSVSNFTAAVESSDPGVTILNGPVRTVHFGKMVSGERVNSGDQLRVSLAEDLPLGSRITFLVTLQATTLDGAPLGPWVETVTLSIVQRESVSGVVRDSLSEDAIEGAVVEGIAEGYPVVSATTQGDGTYALHGLWPDVTYELTAVKPGEYSRSHPPQDVTGQQAGVDFALGKAYADPNPDTLSFQVDQGRSDTKTITLRNDNDPYDTEYVFSVEILYDAGADWLTCLPASGETPADDTLELEVTADAGALPSGIYEATILLIGNDISDEPVEIEVILEVDPAPRLEFYDWVVAGGADQDDDPYVEPGEIIDLGLILVNLGSSDAVGVEGILTYDGIEDVEVTSPNAVWPTLWSPISILTFPTESTTHPTIAVGADVPDGTVLPFTLAVTDSDARAWSFDFEITVMVRRTIMGTVTTCDGDNPVEGAEVRVRDQDDGTLFIATTDDFGAYRVDGLDGFNYTVRVVPPPPYASPEAATVSFPPGNGTEVVDFCVDEWGISVAPEALIITLAEGTSSNVTLSISNDGTTGGSVEFDVQLVSGIVEPAAMGVLQPPPVPWDELEKGEYEPHELLIRFEDSAGPSAQQDVVARYGLQVLRTFSYIPAMRVRVEPGVALQRQAQDLEADPAVRYVEPNYRMELYRIPNDPRFPDMWALNNERQFNGTLGADINVLPAWERTTGSRDVVVAIVDSGTEDRHEDLQANMVPGYDYGEDDDDPRPGYESPDLGSVIHGTHVAGTVGAVGNNEIGIAGVTWEVSLMPLKIGRLTDDDPPMLAVSLDAAIASVLHCVSNNVPISNHSYGGRRFSGIFYEALQEAYAAGHLAIAAAGNDYRNDNDRYPRYPASYNLPNIISVAATNPDGELADFSNMGANSVHIAAPGVNIVSTISQLSEIDPGEVNSRYAFMSGTSMAAPHVAGAAALLKAAAPEATWDMIKRALLDGARRDDGLLDMVATGHLDVMAAMEILSAPWIAVNPPILNVPAGGSAEATVTLNVDAMLLAGTYEATILIRQGLNTIEVPVTLHVTPAPAPKLADVVISDPAPGGDGDGFAEPGEIVDLFVHLRNAGSAFLMSPTGTLTTTVADVSILDNEAVWPSMPSGDVESSLTPFRVEFGVDVTGTVPFTLELTDASGRSWMLDFAVEVQKRHSIRGVLTDAITGSPLSGVRVEYWGDAVGVVTSRMDGAYGIHDLDAGEYRVRPLPDTHEIAAPVSVTLNGADDATQDIVLRQAAPLFSQQIHITAPLFHVVTEEWPIENPQPAAFDFAIREMPRVKAALISDGDQLNAVAPVLRDLGFTVSVYSNNYFYHMGLIAGEARGTYSGDPAVLAAYDLVIADLSGPTSGGRLLSSMEQAAITDYLVRGRQLWITGANPISRPDDRRIRDLVGADSLDRVPAGKAITVEHVPSVTDFLDFEVDEVIQRSALALDLATPADGMDVQVLLGADDAVKVMRRNPSVGGEVVYWGGNRRGGDWARSGVLQDYFRALLAESYWSDVPWLNVNPSSASVSAGNSPVTIALEINTHALEARDYHAQLLVLGNYPGSPVRSAALRLTAERPSFRVKASDGVVDWMGRRLPGDGGGHSALFQVIDAGPDGVPNPPLPNGMPGGDDRLLKLLPAGKVSGRMGVGYENTPDMGRFSQWVEIPTNLPSGASVYVRAWDRASVATSVAYGDSSLVQIQRVPGQSFDFGGWTVDQVLGYPGPDGKDSNGDGILDGWYVRQGLDPRVPIGPLDSTANVVESLGAHGTAANQFNRPHKAFVADHLLFVLDRQNHRVTVWDRNTHTAIQSLGGQGSGAARFNQPYGMGRHPLENLFAVADTENNRIQMFRFNQTTGAITLEQVFGSAGSGPGQFNKPRGVAIDGLGRIIVADTGNHRIQIFQANGTYQHQFGLEGDQTGRFKSPSDVAVDDDGIIYVADTGNHRIQGFTGGGLWLWAMGAKGDDDKQFDNPNGVSIGILGRIFVADTSNHRIQIFSAQRDHLLSVGSLGEGTGQLRFPYGVTPIPGSGAFYAVDTWNNRIQRFETIVDSNGNGVDDVWAFLNFGTIHIDVHADPDEDGLSNLAEFRLRTDPNQWDTSGNGWSDGDEVMYGSDPADPDDVPVVPLFIRTTPSMQPELVIEWPMYSGRTYRVDYTTDLLTGGAWTPLPGSLFEAPANGFHRITNEPPAGVDQSIFYRLLEIE